MLIDLTQEEAIRVADRRLNEFIATRPVYDLIWYEINQLKAAFNLEYVKLYYTRYAEAPFQAILHPKLETDYWLEVDWIFDPLRDYGIARNKYEFLVNFYAEWKDCTLERAAVRIGHETQSKYNMTPGAALQAKKGLELLKSWLPQELIY